MSSSYSKIALIGNPNCGKTTIFNILTGLEQHTGNFAGVTVDKQSGWMQIDDYKIELVDLPGTYSIYPKSEDEQVVFDLITDKHSKDFPSLFLVIVDAANLYRNLLLFSQLSDLGLPVILILNMIDAATNEGIEIDELALKKQFGGISIQKINARAQIGINELKKAIKSELATRKIDHKKTYFISDSLLNVAQPLTVFYHGLNKYELFLKLTSKGNGISSKEMAIINNIRSEQGLDILRLQTKETIERYQRIDQILKTCISTKTSKFSATEITRKIDRWATHKYFGFAFFLLLFLTMFQSIFTWAQYPMDLIDQGVSQISEFSRNILPDGILRSFLCDGLLAGIGGILIFIPQITFLFVFIAILEESGYMARVIFMMDRLMKPFGLNGRSIVPLFSSAACAIPAIMSTRSISNSRERLITIFVSPLIACSARIPVYTIIIALIIPPTLVAGFINLQGIAMFAMYLLGFLMALLSAFLLKLFLPKADSSFLILELPTYKIPIFKNVFLHTLHKVQRFVWGAGKIILVISIILWTLSRFGVESFNGNYSNEIILEDSFIGSIGKSIEPVIAPLGYDWKIGIAILTSFAAREVFVGTISTIYSIENIDDHLSIKNTLSMQVDRDGLPFFNFARGMSLLVFYAFALQCMSTIAAVKKETGKWNIAIYQFIYLSLLAYISSFVVYQVLC